MKKVLFALFLCFWMFNAQAQDPSPTNTMASNTAEVTGFGGPLIMATSIDKVSSVFAGGSGAALFNKQFFFGGIGMGLSTDVVLKNKNQSRNAYPSEASIEFGYGGLMVGYIAQPDEPLHMVYSLEIGQGGIIANDVTTGNELFTQNITQISPRIGMQLNINNWLRADLTGGYRFVPGVTNTFFQGDEFSGGFVLFQLNFGWFGELE